MDSIKIAHISDLHFSKITLQPGQFFSKRWLGNLNLLFSRKKDFEADRLFLLADLFKNLQVQYVIITGDVSTTSLKGEFEKAAALTETFEKAGIEVFVLPGNHDQYTKKAYKDQVFYDYFPSRLKEKGVCRKQLAKGLWLVALDTSLATSLVSSRGYFSPEIEANLLELLSEIPKEDKIIMANHFPLFKNDGPRKMLQRAEDLRGILQKFPNILFYLHGHSHRHCIADLRANGLPIILDSGSTGHRETGSWNLIEISPKECSIQVFKWDDALMWQSKSESHFELIP